MCVTTNLKDGVFLQKRHYLQVVLKLFVLLCNGVSIGDSSQATMCEIGG